MSRPNYSSPEQRADARVVHVSARMIPNPLPPHFPRFIRDPEFKSVPYYRPGKLRGLTKHQKKVMRRVRTLLRVNDVTQAVLG